MTAPADDTLSIVVERDMPHPPEKIWRALTQAPLLEAWLLMKNDFQATLGQRFSFRADWGAVEGEVLAMEPHETLAYSWGDSNLKSVVTWTLAPIPEGTRLRMEQAGFRRDQPRYYGGARAGWPAHFDRLEQALAGLA
ncbi:MAG: SRPBCC domain-containing protein [Caulobacteraceae bacterium]|nr:SRPBCC domain-containing protein [Caulobacteraceae bacterium]